MYNSPTETSNPIAEVHSDSKTIQRKSEDSIEIEELIEQQTGWRTAELKIDRSNHLVQNVVLAGQVSKNGYRYSESALKSAPELYENKPVFLDHAPTGRRPQERSTRDLVGSIVNTRYEDNRIKGDIRVLETESGKTFLALADSEAPSVGMSHVVIAARSADRKTVEQIRDVVSVDAVVFPATTTSLRENEHETRDDQFDALVAERDNLRAERDHWKVTAEELQRRQETIHSRVLAEKEIQSLINELSLPAFAVTKSLLAKLRTATDSVARRQLIQERLELLQELRVQSPTSAERTEAVPSFDDDRFISALSRAR